MTEENAKKPDPTMEPADTEADETFTALPADAAARISQLNQESAKRRVLIKELKAEIAGLRTELLTVKGVETKVSELETAIKSERDARAKAEREALLLKIASANGLPAEIAARLSGTTAEEIEADAKKLAGLFKTPAANNTVPVKPGNTGDVAQPSRAAEILKGITGSQYKPTKR